MNIKVDTKKVMEIIDELIYYSIIPKLSDWLSGYFKLLDTPGDLFLIKQKDGAIEVIASDELLKLQKEARRRYERME